MNMLPWRQPWQQPATAVVERWQEKEEEEDGFLDTDGNWISLFLAKIQASPSGTLPPGVHGWGQGGRPPTGLPNWQPS